MTESAIPVGFTLLLAPTVVELLRIPRRGDDTARTNLPALGAQQGSDPPIAVAAKRGYRSGDCKYEYKADKNGNKEETNCGPGPRSVVEQPSWGTALRDWLRQVTGETEE